MFKKQKRPEDMTYSEKLRALKTNRILTIVVIAVLLYWFYQAFSSPDPVPVWFIFAMSALVIAGAVALLRNFSLTKAFENKHRLEEEQKELLEEIQNEESLLFIEESTDEEIE